MQTKNLADAIHKNYQERLAIAQPEERSSAPREIHVIPKRNAWLREIYGLGIIESSELDRLLFSRLLAYKLFVLYGTNVKDIFYPKTMGLKCFLESYNLLDPVTHKLIANENQIRVALRRAFPRGFVALSDSPIFKADEKLTNISPDPEQFIAKLALADPDIYRSTDFAKPYYSIAADGVTSGERIILQENILQNGTHFTEVRVHTLEERVVSGAIFPRFNAGRELKPSELESSRIFVENFLMQLPKDVTRYRAWSIDVALTNDGRLAILNVYTNRGSLRQWSRFQSDPSILGAYTRHIEQYYNIKFTGLSGFLLRNDLANYPKFLRKKLLEGVL